MRPEFTPATTAEFELIPDLSSWVNHLVHVEGWARGYQFYYRGTINGVHYLETPKTHKKYETTRRLLKTNRQAAFSQAIAEAPHA